MIATPNPPQPLDFQCECGAVHGVLHDASSRRGRRLVCHCNDCQVFAHYLGHETWMLDDNAGTSVYQTDLSRFEITKGREQIACANLTSKSMLRWYCGKCRTPIANTLGSGRSGFISLILTGFDRAKTNALLGAEADHIATRSGAGDRSKLKKAGILGMTAMLWDIMTRAINAWLKPELCQSSLFDSATGKPVATPKKLTRAERLALDEKADVYRDVLAELG
ncbi:DUF6151 family protein [Parasphingorhabdus sp. JC815]|uniref:DUF6151 family protein n=1 Tax=Parasphingorhabdus sp. JC815 TaxID=3232140 RepID=UPI003459FC73